MNSQPDDLSHVRFISAGAGSGKTFRLTQELEHALSSGSVSPAGVIGTTFTVKAASELRDRVRSRLIGNGKPLLAEQMEQALIGTVHSVCERLLARFAFELGLSPRLNVASVEDGARLFNQALDHVLSAERMRQMNLLEARLDLADERTGKGWQDQVKRIADQARSNDIGASALAAMGRESADRFLGFFPLASDGEEITRKLLAALREAIANIDLQADTTIGTARYVDELQSTGSALGRDNCPWRLWISLSKKSPTKKSQAAAIPVRAAASRYDRHPGFHADVCSYVEGVFGIAGETLDRFQAVKSERGLIDYSDMEQLALHALDDPAVAERLHDELELLLVDEFQDTNPLQLGLFMKLASFARMVIFVGDVKQAIYGFRGSDPRLVRETVEALSKRGSSVDVLKKSWRSRPPLVRYLNAVFTAAFARDSMDPTLVTLAPQRTEAVNTPVAACWTLPNGKPDTQASALAAAVAGLIASSHPISDPGTQETRIAEFGDVAVLAATNANVETIAKAFRKQSLPTKMSLSGLLETPEAYLAKACLRRLNDPADTLATAEIRALGACEEPEVWLADRLRWLDAGDDSQRWGEADGPIVSQIARLREQIVTQSPVEIVARVLNYVGIRPIATAWGPDAISAAQRQRNLDAFLQLAVDYETHCASQHEAATLTGFLFWLEHPTSPELDRQPVVTGGNAVHVLTYHRAKGLEWPIVVATDFHYTWRPRLWDVRVTPNPKALDLDNPLEGRRIRFYPNVFGRNTQDIPVLDTIMASEEAAQEAAANAAEGRRLAYVGMTRARETVIAAVPPKAPGHASWITTFGSDHLLAAGDSLALPEGDPIPADCRDLAGAGHAPPSPAPFTPSWFVERTPADFPLRERVNPSEAKAIEGASVGEIVDVGPRIVLHSDDIGRIGTALHGVIAAELINPGQTDAVECAAAIIGQAAGSGAVDPADAVDCARRLKAAIDTRFAPRRVLVEYPVELVEENGQVLRGWIDLLLETAAGWIVLDHKASPFPRSAWADEAIKYSGQLAAYARALQASGLDCAGCWLHFPVGGGLVEVLPGRDSQQVA